VEASDGKGRDTIPIGAAGSKSGVRVVRLWGHQRSFGRARPRTAAIRRKGPEADGPLATRFLPSRWANASGFGRMSEIDLPLG
jgi:hypothetical protein